MSDPWFSEQMSGLVGGIGGGLGALGGCYGGLAGWLAPKGRARGLVLGIHWMFIAIGVASLAIGVAALADGQPYHVWFVFVATGATFAVLFGLLLPVIRARYREAEERRVLAEDLS